ncbi:DUF4381 domain-containing protein [Cognatiluteimonas profundi]|uniref:DUF4381 domain-containing protein n=1 Tax=Cognatiluteimonas profundi TaxID=2594501 RepID=UPI00131D813E|nr:DUF4381 domain-containing protein [Lysobacter profundi]
MQAGGLVLRDIHQPPPPSWWPPAPGWWLLVAAIVLVAGVVLWRGWRSRQRMRALASLFDAALARVDTPAEKVAAMSELLRRAAHLRDPGADKLLGDDWLRFLDAGLKVPVFAAGAGAILRDGGYRRDVSLHEVEALQAVSRMRFLEWMAMR